MKKTLLLFTIASSLLVFSCASDENTVTLSQEELIEISSKLAMLETSLDY